MPFPRPKGVVALVTVLIVMATLVSLGLVIAAIGRDEILLSRTVENGARAFAVADACVEEGLVRLKSSSSYAGGSFVIDGGTCVITVTDLGGNRRLVRGQGGYEDAIRIIDADVTVTFNAAGSARKVKVNSWLEAN